MNCDPSTTYKTQQALPSVTPLTTSPAPAHSSSLQTTDDFWNPDDAQDGLDNDLGTDLSAQSFDQEIDRTPVGYPQSSLRSTLLAVPPLLPTLPLTSSLNPLTSITETLPDNFFGSSCNGTQTNVPGGDLNDYLDLSCPGDVSDGSTRGPSALVSLSNRLPVIPPVPHGPYTDSSTTSDALLEDHFDWASSQEAHLRNLDNFLRATGGIPDAPATSPVAQNDDGTRPSDGAITVGDLNSMPVAAKSTVSPAETLEIEGTKDVPGTSVVSADTTEGAGGRDKGAEVNSGTEVIRAADGEVGGDGPADGATDVVGGVGVDVTGGSVGADGTGDNAASDTLGGPSQTISKPTRVKSQRAAKVKAAKPPPRPKPRPVGAKKRNDAILTERPVLQSQNGADTSGRPTRSLKRMERPDEAWEKDEERKKKARLEKKGRR